MIYIKLGIKDLIRYDYLVNNIRALKITYKGMKKSILLAEDNLKLARFIKNSLVEAGYNVDTKTRGDKAAIVL